MESWNQPLKLPSLFRRNERLRMPSPGLFGSMPRSAAATEQSLPRSAADPTLPAPIDLENSNRLSRKCKKRDSLTPDPRRLKSLTRPASVSLKSVGSVPADLHMTKMQNGPNPKPAFLLQTGGVSLFRRCPIILVENPDTIGDFPHTPQKLERS
jgi:hypothetical protein